MAHQLTAPRESGVQEFRATKENYMGKLEEKIALITDGNGGIALATAKQFVKEGPYVFVTGRRDPELAAEGASADTGGCLHHPECVHCRE